MDANNNLWFVSSVASFVSQSLPRLMRQPSRAQRTNPVPRVLPPPRTATQSNIPIAQAQLASIALSSAHVQRTATPRLRSPISPPLFCGHSVARFARDRVTTKATHSYAVIYPHRLIEFFPSLASLATERTQLPRTESQQKTQKKKQKS